MIGADVVGVKYFVKLYHVCFIDVLLGILLGILLVFYGFFIGVL